jgi:hypothetical protein
LGQGRGRRRKGDWICIFGNTPWSRGRNRNGNGNARAVDQNYQIEKKLRKKLDWILDWI